MFLSQYSNHLLAYIDNTMSDDLFLLSLALSMSGTVQRLAFVNTIVLASQYACMCTYEASNH